MKSKLLLFIILSIFSISPVIGVDWNNVSPDYPSDTFVEYDLPYATITPQSSSVGINIASTKYLFNDDLSNFTYGSGSSDTGGKKNYFTVDHQVAVASVLSISESDIKNGASVTIEVNCPQGFDLVSSSNPAFVRPFNIILSTSYVVIGTYDGSQENRERRWRGLNDSERESVRLNGPTSVPFDLSQKNGAALKNGSDAKYGVIFDIILELKGTVSNGVLTLDNGTTMSLANLDDYMASVSITISTSNIEGAPSQTIVIPFSGFYDSRLGSNDGDSDNFSSLSITSTGRASNIRLDEEQGIPVQVATIDFMRTLGTGIEKTSNGQVISSADVNDFSSSAPDGTFDKYKTRIFLSSSANPEVDGGVFRFIHDDLKTGEVLDDRNSIRYAVRTTDKDTGDIVSFDGTMTSAKLDSSDQVIIPTNMFRLSHLGSGRQGTAWQEYSGTVDIILENKYNIMYSGAYRSYIYVHVFVEDETT